VIMMIIMTLILVSLIPGTISPEFPCLFLTCSHSRNESPPVRDD
jgi:hypothetical protein